MNETFDLIHLLTVEKLTETKLLTLLEKFKTPAAIKNAPTGTVAELVGKNIASMIASLKIDDTVKRRYELVQRLNIRVVTYTSPWYPAWLRTVDHFPPVLFIRGEITAADETAVGVIGTRGATVYGKHIAETFSETFARARVTVVSGMARGVDTASHRGALKAGGRTIAVLGCGVDRCYPPENRKLMDEIIMSGAVISEFAVGTPPRPQNFPKRNRIISALSKAIVAIEAKEKSGVMNTVSWAVQQNKDVYAIPGNIYSRTSTGTNRLIKEGAIPVTSAEEILELMGITHQAVALDEKQISLTESEQTVWDHLTCEPIYLDVLSEKLDQPTGSILNVLLGLEIKGLVRQLPGMMFVKNFE
ncbi:MAG: DNA-processing protein DprA [candidate division WOR-3 bacterium]|nr:MAG: DNA-processing protein DprA [candidate division WOR-3 bacterium]